MRMCFDCAFVARDLGATCRGLSSKKFRKWSRCRWMAGLFMRGVRRELLSSTPRINHGLCAMRGVGEILRGRNVGYQDGRGFFRIDLNERDRIFGLGEMTGPIDKRGLRRELWNI